MNRELYKTDIETIMFNALIKGGFKEGNDFVCQYPIRGSYILDFAFPTQKLDIECDGYHWHKEGNHKDRKRNYFLKSRGWKIIRFTDKQIKNEIDVCLKEIRNKLN